MKSSVVFVVLALVLFFCCCFSSVSAERLRLNGGGDDVASGAGWFFRNYLDANKDGRLTLSDLLRAAEDIEEASSTLKLDATEQVWFFSHLRRC